MNKKLTITVSTLLLSALSIYAGGGVTLKAVRQPAEKVFAEIARQSGKNFLYPAGLLKEIAVTVNLNDTPLEKALEKTFSGTAVGFRIKGNNIILYPQKRQQEATGRKYTVTGFIREEKTGEPLPGAVLQVNGLKYSAVSNAQGFFSVTIPEGMCDFKVVYPGYESSIVPKVNVASNMKLDFQLSPDPSLLEEVIVEGSRDRTLTMNSAEIGALSLSNRQIASTPVIFGESDVIKTLQLEPGVSAGVEGMAGMYVHGGNTDENLYMLDNIPLYQVNHFGGLFSAFNTEALRSVDFYKSTFPARYDGRLSSYMDVHTKDGSMSEHHGSLKLGLTSGAFNIDGPIWKGHTSYSFAIRRSWYDLLTIPAFAIFNSITSGDKLNLGYAFTDLNAKVNHQFSDRSRAYLMFYYGEDYLRANEKSDYSSLYSEDKNNLRWGNTVVSAGWNYVLSPNLFSEFTGAFSRYNSRLIHSSEDGVKNEEEILSFQKDRLDSDNHINDWILKADFDWRPLLSHNLSFGSSITFHTFLPFRDTRTITTNTSLNQVRSNVSKYHANEWNLYGGGDWTVSDNFRLNYGLHFSLFNIEGHTHTNLSPRLSFRWSPARDWSVKGGFSRTVQYVHQLYMSAISLPTDQWVPIVGDQKPQTADKISVAVAYSPMPSLTFSVEGYWKWMDNLLDYKDEYYLLSPLVDWQYKMTSGKGTAKGIDFKVAKEFGKISGHISYSLLWADRTFKEKNHGKTFPARFDNRHKINVMVNWKINEKWEIAGAWTGMSGNMITLPTQLWSDPGLGPWHYDMLMGTDLNNFRLPFYHRLDLSAVRHTRKGFWTFSLYNAYCNLNTIGVQRDYVFDYSQWNSSSGYIISDRPVFKKIRLIPIIPSVSYTWIF